MFQLFSKLLQRHGDVFPRHVWEKGHSPQCPWSVIGDTLLAAGANSFPKKRSPYPRGMSPAVLVPAPHLPRSWMASSNLFSSMAFCTSFVLSEKKDAAP